MHEIELVAGGAVDARITLKQNLEVEVQEQRLGPAPETITAPPFSVNIYAYNLK